MYNEIQFLIHGTMPQLFFFSVFPEELQPPVISSHSKKRKGKTQIYKGPRKSKLCLVFPEIKIKGPYIKCSFQEKGSCLMLTSKAQIDLLI